MSKYKATYYTIKDNSGLFYIIKKKKINYYEEYSWNKKGEIQTLSKPFIDKLVPLTIEYILKNYDLVLDHLKYNFIHKRKQNYLKEFLENAISD